jgi:hypothetical protein
MQLAAQEWWSVCFSDNAAIPVDASNKAQIENAMGDVNCIVVYFTDIHNGPHIAMRSAITRLEYSNPEIRRSIAKDVVILDFEWEENERDVRRVVGTSAAR